MLIQQPIFRYILLLFITVSFNTHAEVIGKPITYKVGDAFFTGYIAYDDSIKEKRPGVIVVHEWWGHNLYARDRAHMLAEQGYTAFALDMYGSGKLAEHPDDAKAFMEEVFANQETAEQRFNAALNLLQQHPTVDKDKIAAIGYCFGGAIVLNMARLGAPLDAVVSFHGSLASSLPKTRKADIKGIINVYSGGDDVMVPPVQIADFSQEMAENKVDFNVRVYKGVKHSFTNPDADAYAHRFHLPLAYDAAADKDSWQQTLALFRKVFK